MMLITLVVIAAVLFLLPFFWRSAQSYKIPLFTVGSCVVVTALFVAPVSETALESNVHAEPEVSEKTVAAKKTISPSSKAIEQPDPALDVLGDRPLAAVKREAEVVSTGSSSESNGTKQMQLSLRTPTYMSIPRGKELNVAHVNCDVLVRFEDKATVLRKGTQQTFKNTGNQPSRIQLELISNNVVGEDAVSKSGLFSSSRQRRQEKMGCRAVYQVI